MDNIAIISDIHGNIPALEAVLEDIGNKGIKRIFCLGDMVGKGPFPEKAVDIVKKSCELVVKGNWDKFITEGKSFDIEVGLWNINKLGAERMDYLSRLPLFIEFYMSGKLVRLFHASSDDVFKRVQATAPIEEKLALFKAPILSRECGCLDSDVVGYGDIHNAYAQNFRGKAIFNVGSVGNPLDIPQASYSIIEGMYGDKQLGSISTSLVRVPYNIEKAVREAQGENMPEVNEFVNELRTARYRGLNK